MIGAKIELHPSVKESIQTAREDVRRLREALDRAQENPLIELNGNLEIELGDIKEVLEVNHENTLRE